jgi:hypothetical protein
MQKQRFGGMDPQLRRRVERMLRGTLGRASQGNAAAAAAAGNPASANQVDDALASVIDAAPALASTAAFKDRRSKAIRELDEQAAQVVQELRGLDLDVSSGGLAAAKSGKGKLAELVAHPALFPLLLKVRRMPRPEGGAVTALTS